MEQFTNPRPGNTMQLPSVDRQPNSRPAGADMATPNGNKVIPVAPVNPPATGNPSSVVNRISEAAAQGGFDRAGSSVYDSATRSADAATSPRDWTIQRPVPEKVQEPPPEPLYKLLLEFLQSMWRASGSAIEIAQAQNQNLPLNQNNPNATPGQLAKENLTYSPSKIRKNENL